MKKLLSLIIVWTLLIGSGLPLVTLAQTNDQVIKDLKSDTADRWYVATDKALVKVIAKTDTTATIEAPVVKRNGQTVTAYYITWAPISFDEMTKNTNTDDLDKVRNSDDAKLAAWGTPIYRVEGDKLIFTISIAEPTKDIYISIEPEDENRQTGNRIEDFMFNLSTVTIGWTTAVAGDISDASLNQAITNVTCVWDATANRTTLLWDINTAVPAITVEVSHRGDEKQGPMDVKWTPNITAKKFVVDTPHRDIQLFRLKPLDGAGAMVGNEIQYICKPDPITQPVVPTNPTKPIPVTPHTWPVETAALVLIVSILGYAIYRKVRRA